jgi:hypothetical protein
MQPSDVEHVILVANSDNSIWYRASQEKYISQTYIIYSVL